MVPVIAGKSLWAGTTLFLDMFSFVSTLRIITIGTVGRLPRFLLYFNNHSNFNNTWHERNLDVNTHL